MTQKDIDRIANQSAKKLGLPSRRIRILRQWFDNRLLDMQCGYIVITDKLIDLSYKLRGKQRRNIMHKQSNKQPDTADFYLTAIKNNKERKEKEEHEQKERNKIYEATHHPCGCRNDAPHSIQCLEYDADKGFKNRFIEHHPNWFDSDEYFTLNFNTTDELLQCEYVARWKKDTDTRKFYQYSLSIDKHSPPMLMVEYDQGTSWWCLGRLRTTDGLNLPKWEPIYEKKRGWGGVDMKPRKARRKTSRDMCPHCYFASCDSAHGFLNTSYVRKRNYRLQNNLCVSCGKNPCGCKRREHKSNVD